MLTRPRALITGASSGIGRALALEFSLKNYDLILLGRNLAALHSVQEECRKNAGTQATVIEADLSLPQAAQKIAQDLDQTGIQVDVLVNNAGYAVHGNF